jgi:hypothetical protein
MRRYRLDSRIASGGVGEVWRATDLLLGRPVAVKLLQDRSAGHPETRARFRAEARHAGALSHPAIAQVYDYGEADAPGPPYLVLELVDGPSLAGVLANGPLDPAATMDVVAQASAGLAAAHAAGLVHRDIKPANLLMGPGGVVKITDFGIAHAAGAAPMTRTGTLVGTPAYLAPERAAGALATPASDLYSLGIVAYECLAGVPPFRGTPLEIAAACQREPLPPLPANVPAPVAALVTALTAKDPAARPGSAGQVAIRAGGLRDAMNGRRAVTPAPGAPSPSAAQMDAPPATRADAPQATLTGQPTMLLRAGDPPGPEDRRARWGSVWRDRPWPRWAVVSAVAVVVGAALVGWLLASAGSSPAQPGLSATRPAASASGTPSARTVNVDAAALAGQPADEVTQQLARLGLHPRLVGIPTGGQRPGTVVAVRPAGQVAAGSTVTVLAAVEPGHGNGDGNGPGNGNGNGHGHGGGGD